MNPGAAFHLAEKFQKFVFPEFLIEINMSSIDSQWAPFFDHFVSSFKIYYRVSTRFFFFFFYISCLLLINTFRYPAKDFFAFREHQQFVRHRRIHRLRVVFSRQFPRRGACAILSYGSETKLWPGSLSFQGNTPTLFAQARQGISSVRRFFLGRIFDVR